MTRTATTREALDGVLDAYREFRDAIVAERDAFGEPPAEMQHAAARVKAAESAILHAERDLEIVAEGTLHRFPAAVQDVAQRHLRGATPPITVTDLTVRIPCAPDIGWAFATLVLEVVVPPPRGAR